MTFDILIDNFKNFSLHSGLCIIQSIRPNEPLTSGWGGKVFTLQTDTSLGNLEQK